MTRTYAEYTELRIMSGLAFNDDQVNVFLETADST